MRAGPAAALALIAAVIGGAAVLVVAQAAGWLHSGTSETVVVRQAPPGAGAAAPVVVARPVLGNGFQPAQIYRTRSQGVVTVISYFTSPEGSAGQGSGFVVVARRHDPDERPCDHERRRGPVRDVGHARPPGLRRLRQRRSRLGEDRRLRPVRRRRRAPRRPAGARAAAGPAGRLEPSRRRPARGGDRQPVRQCRLALGRRHLGGAAFDPVAHLPVQPPRRDPDGRPDQPRELGRAPLRRAWPGDRDQRRRSGRAAPARASKASDSPFRSTRPGGRSSSSSRPARSSTRSSASRPRT